MSATLQNLWSGEQDCQRVQELYAIDHLVILGNDKPNAFKRENGSSDEQRPVVLVEHDDVGDTVLVESQDIVSERKEDHHLDEDEPLHANRRLAVGDCSDEGLQVCGCKYGIRSHEANLTDDDRGQDEGAHMFAVERTTKITKRTTNLELCLDEEHKAVITQSSNAKENQVAEEHTSVEISPRQEEDTRANEGFEK
ncbi:hypothetical protein HG530_009032 [Fusarium avenaceum]|nr:hypothetical protein HG530_009032 [Fusarium avenaceum]